MEETLDVAARKPGALTAWFGFEIASVFWLAWLDQQSVHTYWAGLLAGLLLGCFVQYFVLQALLRNAGYDPENSSFLAFLGLVILWTFGVVLGLLALIVPAFILMARWSLALPILLVEGSSPGLAIEASWERTRENTIPLLFCLIPFFLLGLPDLLLAFFGIAETISSIAMSAILSGLAAVYVVCLTIVLYRSLSLDGAANEVPRNPAV